MRPAPLPQQRLWTAIRILKRNIDVAGLALTARTTPNATKAYLGLLVRAGYLQVEHHGGRRPGNVSLYRIVRNTGHKAPVRAITVMHDPNTDESFPLPSRIHVADRKALAPAPSFVLTEAAA